LATAYLHFSGRSNRRGGSYDVVPRFRLGSVGTGFVDRGDGGDGVGIESIRNWEKARIRGPFHRGEVGVTSCDFLANETRKSNRNKFLGAGNRAPISSNVEAPRTMSPDLDFADLRFLNKVFLIFTQNRLLTTLLQCLRPTGIPNRACVIVSAAIVFAPTQE
jgi:hypothetical protein